MCLKCKKYHRPVGNICRGMCCPYREDCEDFEKLEKNDSEEVECEVCSSTLPDEFTALVYYNWIKIDDIYICESCELTIGIDYDQSGMHEKLEQTPEEMRS